MTTTTARLQLAVTAVLLFFAPLSFESQASQDSDIRSLASGYGNRLLMARAMNMSDTRDIIVTEGVGFAKIEVGKPGCDKRFIKSIMGEPVEEVGRWLNYKPQILFLSKRPIP